MKNTEANSTKLLLHGCNFLKLSELISSSVSQYILSIDNNIDRIRDKKSSVSFPHISIIEYNKFQCLFKIHNQLHNMIIIFKDNSFKINHGYLNKDDINSIINILKSRM